ncbi:MAG TPA: DUF4340 domain-containing protein [Candidatus Aminicenantes bacterium]|nr:DUF4340 domain-containing protein [Candidatus Aminicenantes bacterium]
MKLNFGRIRSEFVVLALVIIGLTLFLLLRNPDRVRYELPQIPMVEREAMDRIEIQSKKGQVVLEKKAGEWQLQPSNHAVDPSRLNSALDALVDLSLTTLVSSSKDFQRYGMDPDSAVQVKAYAGKEVVQSFILGKVASTYRHTFLRFPDDHRIYHASGSLRTRFEYSAQDWRDKTVLAFSKDEISEIDVTAGNWSGTFVRQAAAPRVKDDEKNVAGSEMTSTVEWKSTDGHSVESKIMDPLLQSLSELSCQEFLQAEPDATGTTIALRVSLKGSKEYQLQLRQAQNGETTRYTGTSSMVAQWFVMPAYTVEDLTGKAEALFKPQAGGDSSRKD